MASLATLEGDDNLAITELAVARTTAMLLNNSRPPFDDPLVRQAIQHAVDTQAIIDGVYEGSGEPAVGPFGPSTDWAPEGAAPTPVDLDEARALLDQAGVDPESLSIELMAYNDRPEFADVAAVIQDQLGQLGVEVKIKSGDYSALEPDALAGNFDAYLLSRGYLVDVADPGGYLRSDWTCEGGYNIAHYCDPETDQMIADAVAVEDTGSAQRRLRRDRGEAAERGRERLPDTRERRLRHRGRRNQLRAPPAGVLRAHRRPRPRRRLTRRTRRAETR